MVTTTTNVLQTSTSDSGSNRQCLLMGALLLLSSVLLCSSTPIPITDQDTERTVEEHYTYLLRDTRALFTRHEQVYTDFKTYRHNDASIRIDDFTINGVPSIQDLPQPHKRYNLTQEELLPIHLERLQDFEGTLTLALMDEDRLMMVGENNFQNRLSECLILLRRTIVKLTRTMEIVNIPIPADYAWDFKFATTVNQTILNMRILFVLQEFHENLTVTLTDFSRLRRQIPES